MVIKDNISHGQLFLITFMVSVGEVHLCSDNEHIHIAVLLVLSANNSAMHMSTAPV